MNTERLRKTAYLIFIILGGGALCFCLIKYVLPVLIPFLIAWVVALAVRGPADKISRRIGVSKRVVSPVLTSLLLGLVFALVGFLIFRISREVWQIIVNFGEGEEFRSFIDGFLVSGGILENLVGKFGEGLSDAIFSAATSLLSGLFNVLRSLASALPGAILAIVITVISAIYFSVDLDRINGAMLSLVPKDRRDGVERIKNGFLSVGIKYVFSYFLLFLITFATVLVGFLILKVPYALFLALLVAFLDLLPVIGVGTFLIPYGVFEIVRGNSALGIGLLILFAVQTVIRELAEPKILGKNLGVHPLLTLVILYTSYTLFGFIGILTVPIFTVIAELFLAKKNSADVKRDAV